MELAGKKVAVLAEDYYENLELWYPVLRLREAGAQVTIVGPKAGETYKSKEGYPAKADVAAADVRAADFDAVVIHGGAHYVDQEVVVDGNLITSRTPPDLPAFCREIIRALAASTVGART